MTKIILFLLGLFIITTFLPGAHAAVSPLGLSIAPPVQFPSSEFTITGARLSVLWGSHRDLYGVDIGGIGNITQQEFKGVALSGIFNKTEGRTTAVFAQAAGITNWNTNTTSVYGVQLAAILNMNKATSTIGGLQLALVNMSEQTAIYGVQAGLYNKARVVNGLQIGLVNDTTDLHGLQIGLVNFYHNGTFVVSPILNVGF
jgi:hypothetical protein